MTIIRFLAAASLVFLCSVHPALAQLRADLFVGGLSFPVGFVQDPSQPNVQVVLQQGGRIRVVHNGVLLGQDFLDLTGEVMHSGERGLLGLAFAPDYAASGRVYVSFTNVLGHTVIARFLRDANDSLRADPATRFDLLWPDGLPYLQQPFEAHKAGNMIFGPDGYLYVGVGDGGDENDPLHLAQNPASLLGKMLRLDVSVDAAHPTGYIIPPTNPFVGQPGVLGEIWSFGFRNPWRWSFDDPVRGGTGAIIIADVGQAGWEEVNYEPAGAGGRNYGWRNREGAHDNVITLQPFSLALTEPVFEYAHDVGRSITGGFVYRGGALGHLYTGRYFYADFIKSRVWSLGMIIDPATGEATVVDKVEHTGELGTGAKNISSFGVDANGELYALSYGRGEVYRLATSSQPVTPAPPASPSGCQSLQPGPDWVCAGGNWYPPGMEIPGGTPGTDPEPPANPPANPPVTSPTDPPSTPPTADCVTVQPGPDWTCANGNWYPPGMAIPVSPDPPAPPPTTPGDPPSNGEPAPPVVSPSVCESVQPGPDWTCANGNWYPPGMTIPEGVPPALPQPSVPDLSDPLPPPLPLPPPSVPDTTGCEGHDPFAGIPGLIGTCVGGNWIPVEVMTGTATVEFTTIEGGYWALHFDDGRIFAVEALPAGFLRHGLRVTFAARFKEGVLSVYGSILEVLSIAALN